MIWELEQENSPFGRFPSFWNMRKKPEPFQQKGFPGLGGLGRWSCIYPPPRIPMANKGLVFLGGGIPNWEWSNPEKNHIVNIVSTGMEPPTRFCFTCGMVKHR